MSYVLYITIYVINYISLGPHPCAPARPPSRGGPRPAEYNNNSNNTNNSNNSNDNSNNSNSNSNNIMITIIVVTVMMICHRRRHPHPPLCSRVPTSGFAPFVIVVIISLTIRLLRLLASLFICYY